MLLLLACTAPGGGTTDHTRADPNDSAADSGDAGDTGDTGLNLPLKLGIPGYFYPGEAWDAVVAASDETRILIVNPDSGPGAASDPTYVEAIDRAKAAGILVLGYVSTEYGDRAEANVFADIDNYAMWYNVSGFFIDEVSGAAECAFDKKFYDRVTARAQIDIPGSYVAFNPGTDTCEYFLNIADAIVIFEDSAEAYEVWAPPDWTRAQPPERFWNLVIDTPEDKLISTLQRAVASNVSTVYVTDDVLDNPWDSIPTYWDAEIEALE